jgi:hypothetical protein
LTMCEYFRLEVTSWPGCWGEAACPHWRGC